MIIILFILIIFIVLIMYILTIQCPNAPIEHFCTTKICICMYYTKNVKSYSKLAEQINRSYALKHGYDFKVFYKRLSKRSPQWDKVMYVLGLLTTEKYDYVFWIDSDAYFNLQDKSLTDVIQVDDDHDLYICSDLENGGHCTVNTGTFLIKNTSWSKNLLTSWWSHPDAYMYYYRRLHEQSILDIIVRSGEKRIKIYPAEKFNSIYSNLDQIDSNFIVHLMARSNNIRIDKMKKYIMDNSEK